jgi:hypothetical protein
MQCLPNWLFIAKHEAFAYHQKVIDPFATGHQQHQLKMTAL